MEVTGMGAASDWVRKAGAIAIVRGDFPLDQLAVIADALAQGGVSVVEITLNSKGALAGIERVRRKMDGRVLVGAGTVRTVLDAEQAMAAGAQFLVSPNSDPATMAWARAAGMLHLPGIFTASEAQAAFAAGCRMVKLFPADALGPGYLKALRAPLDDIDFVPTGGIDAGNLAGYIRAGAVAVGVGSALVSPHASPAVLTQRAAAIAAALQTAREGGT